LRERKYVAVITTPAKGGRVRYFGSAVEAEKFIKATVASKEKQPYNHKKKERRWTKHEKEDQL
jgi:hypothetical protein